MPWRPGQNGSRRRKQGWRPGPGRPPGPLQGTVPALLWPPLTAEDPLARLGEPLEATPPSPCAGSPGPSPEGAEPGRRSCCCAVRPGRRGATTRPGRRRRILSSWPPAGVDPAGGGSRPEGGLRPARRTLPPPRCGVTDAAAVTPTSGSPSEGARPAPGAGRRRQCRAPAPPSATAAHRYPPPVAGTVQPPAAEARSSAASLPWPVLVTRSTRRRARSRRSERTVRPEP